MLSLLADTNVQRHATYLRRLLERWGLLQILEDSEIQFLTFADVGLPRDLSDRLLWGRCQDDQFVLLTENRNDDTNDSLPSTLRENWKPGDLPVITIADKTRFELDADYRERVVADVAELLFGIAQGEYRDLDRIYVPL